MILRLRFYLDKPLFNILYPESGETSTIDETIYTQPAIFALKYALAQLWKSSGIQPSVVMGHSVGEYVAATVPGVFSLEDGLKLIANQRRLMQALPSTGEIVSILASESQVDSMKVIHLSIPAAIKTTLTKKNFFTSDFLSFCSK